VQIRVNKSVDNLSHLKSGYALGSRIVLTNRRYIEELYDPSWHEYWETVYNMNEDSLENNSKSSLNRNYFETYMDFDILYRRSKIHFKLGGILNQYNEGVPVIVKGSGKKFFNIINGSRREFYKECLKNVGFNRFAKQIPNEEVLSFPEREGLTYREMSAMIKVRSNLFYSGTYWTVKFIKLIKYSVFHVYIL
jgi:hypothetical protein